MKFLVSLLSLGLMISAQAEDVKMEKVFTPEAIISGKAFLEKSNQSPEAKGTIIAKAMEASNEGFKAETSDMEMVLIDAYGAKITRAMEGKVYEVPEDGDKSLMEFLNPKDVKGTKMLTHSHKNDDDDQWLYLPTIRRVKRISSSSKSSSFMASEFSFEDLGSQEVEKYNYTWLEDIKIDGVQGWKLQRVPKTKSGYSKMILKVSSKTMSPVEMEYYDRKDELLKVATFSKFKSYEVGGKTLWRSNKIHMKNVQTKKESIFEWKDRKLGVDLKEREFKKNSLK